jgi:indolepyruvate ferredoxin oxidoreductase
VFINESVCEGCGDCSSASNCVSIEPIETKFGRKRRVDQSTCNQDFSCVKGFCPSFVTVEGGKQVRAPLPAIGEMREPEFNGVEPASDTYNILLAGIGGQGITSLSAVIGMAGHLDGRGLRIVDQLGMAQKGGAVHAHIRIGPRVSPIHGPHVGAGQADLILAADIVVGHGAAILPCVSVERTNTLLNGSFVPTSAFVSDNEIQYDQAGMCRRLKEASRSFEEHDAGRLASRHFGDTIFAGIILLGIAYQRGLVPLTGNAIERAIELNGAAVADNLAAFRLGRHLAIDPGLTRPAAIVAPATGLDSLIAQRAAVLAVYQNEAYAQRYRDFLAMVRNHERAIMGEQTILSVAVARALFKLMAYKDEYEVARLYTNDKFSSDIAQHFGPGVSLRFHMAPPILGRHDPDNGLPIKSTFGPWLMPALRILSRFKFLRGTGFDPFGRSAERRMERALVDDYQAGVARLLNRLSTETYASVVEYACVAETIRGYGHVKAKSVAAARSRFAEIEAKISA